MYRLFGYDFTSIHCHLFYILQWRILNSKEGRRKKGARVRQIERVGGREKDEDKVGREEGKEVDPQREACESYWSFAKSSRFALNTTHHVCRPEELYSRSKMGADMFSSSSLSALLFCTY